MNSEYSVGGPERQADNLDRQTLPEVDLSLLRTQRNVEVLPSQERAPEHKELQADRQASRVDGVFAQPVKDNPKTTVKPDTSSLVTTRTIGSVLLPSQAKNTDRIEQEWVDAAKSIIAATIENPYECEEQIKDLQADYLFKRYGRRPGDSNPTGAESGV